MSSEWMKVMLDEISRKKAENEQARAEEVRREDERQRQVAPAPVRSGVDRARG
jgi:hypothetical protein